MDEHELIKIEPSPALTLLNRPLPHDYKDSWTNILVQEKNVYNLELEELYLFFRLRSEFFALSAITLKQVSEVRKIHALPHAKTAAVKGIVNIYGQIKVCVSLENLLELAPAETVNTNSITYSRMIVIENSGQTWVFVADEVLGLQKIAHSRFENVPINLHKSSVNFLKGILSWEGKSIGILDEELMFSSLRRRIL